MFNVPRSKMIRQLSCLKHLTLSNYYFPCAPRIIRKEAAKSPKRYTTSSQFFCSWRSTSVTLKPHDLVKVFQTASFNKHQPTVTNHPTKPISAPVCQHRPATEAIKVTPFNAKNRESASKNVSTVYSPHFYSTETPPPPSFHSAATSPNINRT